VEAKISGRKRQSESGKKVVSIPTATIDYVVDGVPVTSHFLPLRTDLHHGGGRGCSLPRDF
jgi:hypothetical protein